MSSDYAWRMARYYGSEISRMTRGKRIAFLEQRIAVLSEVIEAECRAHEASCKDCQEGEFCLARFSITPTQKVRYDELSHLRGYVHHEKADEEYAQRARSEGVIYKHHIDGFCRYWQNLRHRLFVVADHRCQRCGTSGPLEAHHRHYDTLGFEEIADLEALCADCHEKADQRREYATGLATYARKKYGKEWRDQFDAEYIEEEFDRWRENKTWWEER
jgi:5-methylcytosine-specific restriction endonuclease McrA